MKKLFVSVPMRGRKWKDVLKSVDYLKEQAEKLFGEKLILISSEVKQKPDKSIKPELTGLWYLGESLKILAKADVFIGVACAAEHGFNGCEIENQAAAYYGILPHLIDIYEACPDIKLKDEAAALN